MPVWIRLHFGTPDGPNADGNYIELPVSAALQVTVALPQQVEHVHAFEQLSSDSVATFMSRDMYSQSPDVFTVITRSLAVLDS